MLNRLQHKTHADVYFMASLASRVRSDFVVSDLRKHGINTSLCVYSDKHDMTISYIIVSLKTRSRTILNHPCLKALKYEDFIQSISANSIDNNYKHRPDELDEDDDTKTPEKRSRLLKTIDDTLLFVNTYPFMESRYKLLDKIKVIHVEARWIRSMAKILAFLKKKYPKTFISIEIEKERLYDSDDARFAMDHSDSYPVNDLIAFADLVFFSRQLVKERGYAQQNDKDSPHVFIKDIMKQYGNNRLKPLTVVVPWSDTGAYGAKYDCTLGLYDEAHRLHTVDIAFSPSCPPKEVVDTIGAGDTFIGAYLHYAWTHDIWHYDIKKCLDYANQVAGFKVGHYGFDCVKHFRVQP